MYPTLKFSLALLFVVTAQAHTDEPRDVYMPATDTMSGVNCERGSLHEALQVAFENCKKAGIAMNDCSNQVSHFLTRFNPNPATSSESGNADNSKSMLGHK